MCSIVGAGAVAVVARTVSTFPGKNVLKSSAVWVTDVDATERSNEIILFQSELESEHMSMADDQ